MKSLQLNSISFSYPSSNANSQRVLSDLHLAVPEGRFVSILGRSASGKTTLLSLIAHFAKPTAGTITNTIGDVVMVFQQDALFPWLNAKENLEYPRRCKSLPIARDGADNLLARVGLEGLGKIMPYELSGGQRRRLEFARAWHSEAPLVLLDEPFSGLDYQTRLESRDMLQDLWLEIPKTLLMVTHDPEDACWLSDEVYILRNGTFLQPIPIAFQRPRERELRFQRDFVTLQEEVSRL